MQELILVPEHLSVDITELQKFCGGLTYTAFHINFIHILLRLFYFLLTDYPNRPFPKLFISFLKFALRHIFKLHLFLNNLLT